MSTNLVSRNFNADVQTPSYSPFIVNFSIIPDSTIVVPGYGIASEVSVYVFDIANLGITNLSSIKSLQFTLDFQSVGTPDPAKYGQLIIYVPDSGQTLLLCSQELQRPKVTGVIPIISNGMTKIFFIKQQDTDSGGMRLQNQLKGFFIASNMQLPPFVYSCL